MSATLALITFHIPFNAVVYQAIIGEKTLLRSISSFAGACNPRWAKVAVIESKAA